MPPSVTRPDYELAYILKNVPKLGQVIDQIRQARGTGDLSNWPDNVLLPAQVWVNVYFSLFYGRLPDRPTVLPDALEADISSLMAVGTWMYSRDIYRFNPDAFKAIASTEIPDNVPLHIFRDLPSWSLYIEFPQSDVMPDNISGYGCYVHLNYDNNHGAWELILTLDDNAPLYIMPLELTDSMTLEQAIMSYSEADVAGLDDISRQLIADDMANLPKFVAAVKPVLSLLLYICSGNAEINGAQHHRMPFAGIKSTSKLIAPPETSCMLVGKQLGDDIREQHLNGCGDLRWAYWDVGLHNAGSEQTEVSCKWMPPTLADGYRGADNA